MALQAQHLEHMPDDGCGKPDGLAPIELADIAAGQGGGSPSTVSPRTTAPASR